MIDKFENEAFFYYDENRNDVVLFINQILPDKIICMNQKNEYICYDTENNGLKEIEFNVERFGHIRIVPRPTELLEDLDL